jgi:hypothetical protein
MRKFLTFAAALLFTASAALADTFRFAGAQLELPDGWTVKTEGRMASLYPPAKGAFVEVYNFSAVPKADPEAIAERLRPRRNTTEVKATKAESLEQHGLKGTAAEGTAKIGGAPVRFRIVALPMGQRAVLAAAFVSEKAVGRFEKEIKDTLGSLRSAP